MAHLFVVDDDSAVREVMTTLLERRGHSATILHDGDELLAALAASEQLPDLLIVDWAMPGGGPELLRSLRAAHPELPVILMSGSEWGLEERLEQMEAPADVFLRKPFDLIEVDRAIAATLFAGERSDSERRNAPRRTIPWRAELRAGDAVTPGLVRDLSISGAQLRVPSASDLGAPGEEISGVVYGPGGTVVELAARVVYRQPVDEREDRIGLAFLNREQALLAVAPLL
jgi:DNA-binding response OmpR family regulator